MNITILSKNWNKLAVFAAGIVGTLAGFLVMPPAGVTASWKQFSVFFVALFAGLWLVPVNRWNSKRNTTQWWLIAIIGVLLGLSASLTYSSKLGSWTVRYWRDQRVVIGQTKTPFGEEIAAELNAHHLPFDDATLLAKFQGRANDVWRSEEISARELRLELLYVLTVFLLTSAVIAVLQALYCSSQKAQN